MKLDKDSKIAVVGNLGNIGYSITKTLRQKDFNIDLYITSKTGDFPKTQNPYLKNNINQQQEWIKIFTTKPIISSFLYGKTLFKKYDLVIALTLSPAYIQFFNKNFISVATGSDIREYVFQKGIYNILLRKAYKNAKHIFYTTAGLYEPIEKLGLTHKASFLPLIIDLARYKEIPNTQKHGELKLFWPSSWVKIKGYENFLKACSWLFNQGYTFHITIVDNSKNPGVTPHDLSLVHEFIKKYEKHITLIPRIKENKELILDYLKADLIIDQFILGDIGLIDLEAMALGRPVLDYFNHNYSRAYSNEAPPIINVFSETDIIQALKNLVERKDKHEYLNQVGEKAKQWAKKFHNPEVAAEKIIKVINEI